MPEIYWSVKLVIAVFSKDEIETHAQRLVRSNDARHIEHVRFFGQPQATPYANHRGY